MIWAIVRMFYQSSIKIIKSYCIIRYLKDKADWVLK